MAKPNVDQILFKANAHAKKGETGPARQLYEAVLRMAPANKLARQGLERLGAAPAPSIEVTLTAELAKLYKLGAFGVLRPRLTKALQAFPNNRMLWILTANVERAEGRFDRAIDAFRRVTEIDPGYPDGHNDLGIYLKAEGLLDEAEVSIRRAIALRPDYPEAHNNLGNVLRALGRLDEALECYKQALGLRPDYIEAHNNMGNLLQDQGRAGAEDSYRRALELNPDFGEAHYNYGSALEDQGRLDEAMESYRRALELKPDFDFVKGQLLHLRQMTCDWSVWPEIDAALPTLGIVGDRVPPFVTLAMEDNPERQLQRSIHWREKSYSVTPTVSALPAAKSGKIRIGYFSADFYDHATLYLMAGLLRLHDRTRFEIYTYGYGRTQHGIWRDQMIAEVDAYTELRGVSDEQAADLVRHHRLDIAIDLKGYTKHTRSELFARRLAPLQINYLGYPGSMGADFIDYLVADHIVVPPQERRHYSENVIFLPGSYQPNDDHRRIADSPTTRSMFGLPDDAFVFCSFNNSYKIGPREFDIWMRVLKAVDGSVLWLLRANRWVEANLRREAAARGVDPARLIFAANTPHAEHLSRHKHADLFLDSFAVNAHTTASDALWAGLPVVTRKGRQFAARVAASLLHAVDLGDLVTDSDEAYEALVLDLAHDPERLEDVRTRLGKGRTRAGSLFDTATYTRHFESALAEAHRRRLEGLPPADFTIGADA
ncbi:tetratricopeptide repeat protein [Ciceribacter sp. L1K22]|uniref:O-linked N-acetylglucosamine transferase, SPINDLY family protein n=1 Tax=Ciceribacter sp. L1K22 TaxID=2820275 RepID=UPI001ABE69C7|nr:tetratricopeptide repeat protein [Ciceribacter sp. L1K22]MBO3762366.1 tetratricopeptide repeat protein [Ciceribacter sp. L1K22]